MKGTTSSENNNNNKSHNNNNKTIISQTNNLISHQNCDSYNELLNMRTTLLHMQYLYSSLNASLTRQHQNQQRQHKDHIIQCYNLQAELDQIESSNFTKLLIVKLQEFLALQADLNEKLLQNCQSENEKNQNKSNNDENIKQKQKHNQNNLRNNLPKQYQILSKLDRLKMYIQIRNSEIQQSLCKLYIGDKVMLDLEKTTSRFNQIQSKIDKFLQNHSQTIKSYNQTIKQLEQNKKQFKNYMQQTNQFIKFYKIEQRNNNNNNNNLNQTNNKYQKHVNKQFKKEQIDIQKRIEQLKNTLLAL